MAKLIYIATLFLAIALVSAGDDSDSGESAGSTTEGKAGEAIKTLLQEKITQKFKEAANEVKGVLVKQLGDSLKSAHDVFNPPKDKAKATAAASGAKVAGKQGKYLIKTAKKRHGNAKPKPEPSEEDPKETILH